MALRACIYCRISKDREGEALGVGRQEEDCPELGHKLSTILGQEVVVGRVYIDNDISASTRSGKPRPDVSEMTADIQAGLWDLVLSYSNSRLTRKAEYEAPAESAEANTSVLSAQIMDAEGEIARLRDAYQAGIFTMEEVSEKVVPLRERVIALKAEQVTAVRAAHSVTLETADAIAVWRSEDPDLFGQRRQILAKYVKRVVIKPLPSRQGWGIRKPLPPDCIEIIPVP